MYKRQVSSSFTTILINARTCHDTLSAIDTGGICKIGLKGAAYNCIIAAVLHADGADSLHPVARTYTAAAKDTFIGIPHNRRACSFQRHRLSFHRLEVVLLHAVIQSIFLQFAGLGTDTGKTFFLVGRKLSLIHIYEL